MTTLREFKAGRKKQGCNACGATSANQTPWRIGVEGSCKSCGASKWKQRYAKTGRPSKLKQSADAELDAMLSSVVKDRGAEMLTLEPAPEPVSQVYARPVLKASNKMAADRAWQAQYDKRRDAEKRLGMHDEPANDWSEVTSQPRNIGQGRERGAQNVCRADIIRAIEDKIHPRVTLLEAARAGDEDAIERAEALFGSTWKKQQRVG